MQNSPRVPFHPYFEGKIKRFVSPIKNTVFCNSPLSLFNEMFVILVSLLGRGNVNESLLVLLFASSSLRLKQGSQRRYQHFSHSGVGCYDPPEVSTNRKTSPNELHFPPLHSPD